MNTRIIYLICIAFLGSQCTSPSSKITRIPTLLPDSSAITIPDNWIEKIRRNNYQQDDSAHIVILKEFEEYISPDTLHGTSESVHYQGGVVDEQKPGARFNALFVNLDEDPDEEMVGTFGYARHNPSLGVFKKIGGAWHLLYLEPFFLHGEEPELQVANNYSAHKVFFVRHLQERGSGIYMDTYNFYKLINGKVYPCLQLMNEAHILGWGKLMNQKTSSKFEFNSATADELWVDYRYDFFAGPMENDDMSWDSHQEISFVQGEAGASYEWNNSEHIYQLSPENIPDGLNKLRLTADKVACFNNFNNDTLFIRAFTHELNTALKEGNKQQKEYLKRYLISTHYFD